MLGGQNPLTAFFFEIYVTQLKNLKYKFLKMKMARVNQKTFPHSSKQSIIFIVHNYTI